MNKEAFLSLAASRYEELEKLGALDNFYDFEKLFDVIWQDLGREYLEKFLQEQKSNSKERGKKKH